METLWSSILSVLTSRETASVNFHFPFHCCSSFVSLFPHKAASLCFYDVPFAQFLEDKEKKPPGSLQFSLIVVVFLLCDYLQRVFSSVALFSFFFVFKVVIHFDFILHSFLFLIFLPRLLYSCLQLPAMLTQPALRRSELLKPLPPSPLWRSGPPREDWGRWRDQEMRVKGMEGKDL